MMDDLINRQAAIDILDAYQVMLENGEENPYSWARFRMSELPAAQPEIIRCKDCKYYTSVTAQCEIRGKGLYLIRGMEDFCSRAERRADE